MGIGQHKVKKEILFMLILAAIAAGVMYSNTGTINKLIVVSAIIIVFSWRIKGYINK